ncbi:MAG: UpxY family transcription antiterminator [Ginsengibacter sp.]
MKQPTDKKWYVVYTRPRWEKKVVNLFNEKGIENYCPLNKVTKQWSDRKKVVEEPIFKGYVFVKVSEDEKWKVASVNGVLNYIYWLGKPAVVRDEEIATIRKFLNEFDNVEVSKNDIHTDTKVRIVQGVLMNYEGMVIEVFGSRAIVKIESLDLSISAHFDKKNLEII